MPIPNAPTNLILHPSVGTAAPYLTWTDNSSDETQFRVYESRDGGSFIFRANKTANTQRHDIDLLERKIPVAGTYTYKVLAYNSSGESPPTNTVDYTWSPIPPPAPSNLNLMGYPDIANTTISFTDNSTTYENSASEYILYWTCTDPVDFAIYEYVDRISNGEPISRFVESGYTFLSMRVTAQNVAGASGFSNTISFNPAYIQFSNVSAFSELTAQDLSIARNKGWLISNI